MEYIHPITPSHFPLIYTSILSLLNKHNPHLFNLLLRHTINFSNRRQMITTEDIELRISEFACRHTTLEKHIHLTIRPPLRLRQSKENPHNTKRTAARPKERTLGRPSPTIWFRGKLISGEDVDDDAADVVEIAGEDDGFSLEACGGHFRDERVAHWTNGEVVHESEDQKHTPDSPARGLVGSWGYGGKAYDEKESEEGAGAVEVECASASAVHQEPGANGAEHAEGVLGHGEVEGGSCC